MKLNKTGSCGGSFPRFSLVDWFALEKVANKSIIYHEHNDSEYIMYECPESEHALS